MSSSGARLIPPPLLLLACLIPGVILQSLQPVRLAPYSFGAGMAGGAILLLIVVGIGGSAMRELRRHETTIRPDREPSRLVTTGPFRFTRNPLYVSLLTFVAALAVMVNSAWLVLSGVTLFLLLDRFVVRREEPVIARKFAAEYEEYRSRVRRWL